STSPRLSFLILGEALFDEDPAQARPFEVLLQVREARLPAGTDFSAIPIVGRSGVRDELLDRHQAAIPNVGESQDHAEPLEAFALSRLQRDLAHDEPSSPLELGDLAEDRRLGAPP